jgi:hypothetical protein
LEENLNLLGKDEDSPKKQHKIRKHSFAAAFDPVVSNYYSSKQRRHFSSLSSTSKEPKFSVALPFGLLDSRDLTLHSHPGSPERGNGVHANTSPLNISPLGKPMCASL